MFNETNFDKLNIYKVDIPLSFEIHSSVQFSSYQFQVLKISKNNQDRSNMLLE